MLGQPHRWRRERGIRRSGNRPERGCADSANDPMDSGGTHLFEFEFFGQTFRTALVRAKTRNEPLWTSRRFLRSRVYVPGPPHRGAFRPVPAVWWLSLCEANRVFEIAIDQAFGGRFESCGEEQRLFYRAVLRRMLSTDGRKPISSIRRFVENDDADGFESHQPAVQKSPRRPGVAISNCAPRRTA